MVSTIFSKIWDKHVLAERSDGLSLIYIDRHLTHEVTSPLAFESLRAAGRKVRRPDLTFAVMDHNVPTGDRSLPVADPMSDKQMKTLFKNTQDFGIEIFDYKSPLQGIVHVIGPELGLTLPGITLTCGDSHTATHGALGALAFGVGTSEGEHVFATQTLWFRKPKQMEILLKGKLPYGITAKDVVLWTIRQMGTGGAIGYAAEYAGEAVRDMTVEQRMTLTNMSIEGGARTAIVQPDKKVYEYLRNRRYTPSDGGWDQAIAYWDSLTTDPGAKYDASRTFDISSLEPQISWGTNPGMTVGVTERVPSPNGFADPDDRKAIERALKYMGLEANTKITEIPVDTVFIGSCTNARLSDLIDAARVLKGRRVSSKVRAMVVPGSMHVKRRAEAIGLDKIYTQAGFDWRNAGCSMCIAMNEDRLGAGERCASTSNRNFENRQGVGGRTHLVSPLTAAATAVEGRFVDVRNIEMQEVAGLGLEGDLNA